MSQNPFDMLQQAVRSFGRDKAFELLVQQLRDRKQYPQLFEAILLKKRAELGLPLIQTEPLGDLPDEVRRQYEDAYIEAARQVGGLFLDDGDIPRAWPYFRAIGESGPVAEAIERLEPGENQEEIIEIAFHEQANPRKGFELILRNYGTCSAITSLEQYAGREGGEECIRLVVRKLHEDVVENLKGAIADREGKAPDSRCIPELISGRDWLFEDNCYHIDTSHLSAVVRFSIELADRETLVLAVELTEYGKRLSPMFQYRGNPPFEDVYVDYGSYLRALQGDGVDEAVAHFRQKLQCSDPEEAGTAPAQVLVALLARLGRYSEAIEVAAEQLDGLDHGQLLCPSVAQLCQLAGQPQRLMELARDRDDLVNFMAAALQL